MHIVLSAVQKRTLLWKRYTLLTMWHKLALSVIPPVRTQHAIVGHVLNLSWVIVLRFLRPK